MIGSLNVLDVLFIAIFFFSVLFGLLRGLVREVLAVGFLAAAVALAFIYHRDAGLLLGGLVENRELADLAGFLLILLAVGGAGALISALIGKFVVVGPLKAMDRLLGAVFGLLRAALLSAIVVYAFVAYPLNERLLNQSRLAPHLVQGMKIFISILPPVLRDRLKAITTHDYEKTDRDRRAI
jgi:membrane protein required for colicin V production